LISFSTLKDLDDHRSFFILRVHVLLSDGEHQLAQFQAVGAVCCVVTSGITQHVAEDDINASIAAGSLDGRLYFWIAYISFDELHSIASVLSCSYHSGIQLKQVDGDDLPSSFDALQTDLRPAARSSSQVKDGRVWSEKAMLVIQLD
jgi:hypothetical protein